MDSTNRDTHIAGLLYLIFTIVGFFDLMYVPGALFVTGNAGATAHNIAAHETLFRWGIFSELVVGVIGLVVALWLYRLFVAVDRTQAVLLLILGGLMPVPLYFWNAVNYVAALLLIHGGGYLSVIAAPQRDAMARLFLTLHHYELLASFIFAGLWLFPFGILVFKSGFLPRTLGVWLILNGVAYLVISVSGFVAPQYSDVISTITFPVLFGEVAIMLWMLILGARPALFPLRGTA
jgi:uncharacterized membrane protein YeaQ/YmgE (transglycosylase-associated protein family)